jgi:hypothetical protein
MAKLPGRIALILLPVLLYFGVFIAFEPNNYFGFKPRADGTDIIAALRQYERAPKNRIILGDSRLAKFSPAAVEALTGHPYANLAYGGAALKEQLDIADWAIEKNDALEEILFMVSFYTLNRGYNHDRSVIQALNNPLAYITNLGYNLNMLTNLAEHLSRSAQVGGSYETMDPADYTYADYTLPVTGQTVTLRETVGDHLINLLARSENWRLNESLLGRLLETIASCAKKGVRFVLVLPPACPDVHRCLIGPLGIEAPMRQTLEILRQTDALVLDYEFSQLDLLRGDQFYDGFHLDLERGLPAWTKALFTAVAAGEESARAA